MARRDVPGAESAFLGRIGIGLLAVFTLVAVLAPLIAPYDPTAHVTTPFARPSSAHPLGGNDVGQDLLSELVYGTRISLVFGIAAAVIGAGVGLLVGLSAGYFRGAVDTVLMRLVDVVLVMPFLPLLLILAAFIGPGVVSELVVISAVIWAGPARELRSQTLSIRERGHVEAALAMGAKPGYVLRRHVLPGVASLIPPQLVRAAKGAILLEASLSFLGLGDPTVRSWGTMLYYANARSAYLTDAWLWWVIPPGLALAGLVLAFALTGYALETWGRPRAAVGAAGSVPVRRPARRTVTTSDAGASGVLAIRDLDVDYGAGETAVRAVRSIDLDVGGGEIVGLIGESGSGKTTIVGAILGVLPPGGHITAGRITLAGRDLLSLPEAELRQIRGNRIALIPQAAQNALNPVMRIADQVAEAIVAHDRASWAAARVKATALLSSVRIPRNRHRAYPHEFSGGMRQRALIAMALANDPELVVADEPTTGLDGTVKLEVLELLAELVRETRCSLLLVSHDLPAVFHVADRVSVMREGEIVDAGTPGTLAATAVHPYTRRLLAALPTGTGAGPAPVVGDRPILVVDGVGKRFGRSGDVAALADVDLEVCAGEIVGLVGESGAGKSTLVRLIFGLESPDEGHIEFRPETRDRSLHRKQMVFQDPYSALPPHLRVRAIVAEPLRICGLPAGKGTTRDAETEAVVRALEEVELRPAARFLNRFPHELSGGERQRVALARALIVEPDLIVADEPASLLDASLRRDLVAQLARVRRERGTAILYITHDIGLAGELCDRLIVLDAGRVVEHGPTSRLLATPRHPSTAEFVEVWRRLARPLQSESRLAARARISDTAGESGS